MGVCGAYDGESKGDKSRSREGLLTTGENDVLDAVEDLVGMRVAPCTEGSSTRPRMLLGYIVSHQSREASQEPHTQVTSLAGQLLHTLTES